MLDTTFSPFHPQGNGKAENAVKITKRLLKKMRGFGTISDSGT